MSGWHFKKYTNKVELYPKMQDVCVHLNFKNDSASLLPECSISLKETHSKDDSSSIQFEAHIATLCNDRP